MAIEDIIYNISHEKGYLKNPDKMRKEAIYETIFRGEIPIEVASQLLRDVRKKNKELFCELVGRYFKEYSNNVRKVLVGIHLVANVDKKYAKELFDKYKESILNKANLIEKIYLFYIANYLDKKTGKEIYSSLVEAICGIGKSYSDALAVKAFFEVLAKSKYKVKDEKLLNIGKSAVEILRRAYEHKKADSLANYIKKVNKKYWKNNLKAN